MQKLIIRIVYTFLGITVATAALALIGIIFVWFFNKNIQDLPYLKWLLSACLAEIIAITFLFTKRGMKYLPEVHIMKTPEETLNFMEKFITAGSNATILSNRASWLLESESLIDVINKKIQKGMKVEIITNMLINGSSEQKLPSVSFLSSKHETISRFTLINSNRSGAEKLAIAKGNYPTHEITVFDNTTGPQMIGMAKDIIKIIKDK